ncbi:MAG: IS5 family transposase [Flavobacteriales bacterium]|nr:IS5 family transposase [Flavobacteriales bacterium]
MIHYKSSKQQTLEGFHTPFDTQLDKNNRWVKLAAAIPWDELAVGYYKTLSPKNGRKSIDARIIIGSVILKHKLNLSDEEIVEQIKENPYFQYFIGNEGYEYKIPFVPSLFVEIRKRMGNEVFADFQQAIVDEVEELKLKVSQKKKAAKKSKNNDDEPPIQNINEKAEGKKEEKVTHQGKLIIDATVVEQAIRYPTDLGLLNEAREKTEKIIDILYKKSPLKIKPRTYREIARSNYLSIVKQKKPKYKTIRKGIRQQLQYLRRNINHIHSLLDRLANEPSPPLKYKHMRQLWVIKHLVLQQEHMYKNKVKRCDGRIVSIHQPHVRPIIRGKQNKSVEFGSKLNVSLTTDGISYVNHIGWNNSNEGKDMKLLVNDYKRQYGYYPEAVVADPLYGSRENRNYLKGLKIRFAGKPLGRPVKITPKNNAEQKQLKKQRKEEYLMRIPIEGKFGQGKSSYSLGYIKAKTKATSEAWINSIFLVMNILVLYKIFYLPNKILTKIALFCKNLLFMKLKLNCQGLKCQKSTELEMMNFNF